MNKTKPFSSNSLISVQGHGGQSLSWQLESQGGQDTLPSQGHTHSQAGTTETYRST